VEVVHVRSHPEDPYETPEWLARRHEVPFRLLEGPVDRALQDAIAVPEVIIAVIGARSAPGGRQFVGSTVRKILERTEKPVVVVPPGMVCPDAFRRLLLPLEGTRASSQPVQDRLWPLLSADVELIVLHVFSEATMPEMLDRPEYDMDILEREFLNLHCPQAGSVLFRHGPVAARVAELSSGHRADLVVLSWSQDSSGGRATVIRNILGASALPVLLLPVGPSEATSGSTLGEPET
jgi:hypothetical protein